MVPLAQSEMDYAGKMGKKVVLLAEIASDGYLSFGDEDPEYMEEELEKVNEYYMNYPAYNGIGMHHNRAWMDMAQYIEKRTCSSRK